MNVNTTSRLRAMLALAMGATSAFGNYKQPIAKPHRGRSGDKLARKAAKGEIGIRKHW